MENVFIFNINEQALLVDLKDIIKQNGTIKIILNDENGYINNKNWKLSATYENNDEVEGIITTSEGFSFQLDPAIVVIGKTQITCLFENTLYGTSKVLIYRFNTVDENITEEEYYDIKSNEYVLDTIDSYYYEIIEPDIDDKIDDNNDLVIEPLIDDTIKDNEIKGVSTIRSNKSGTTYITVSIINEDGSSCVSELSFYDPVEHKYMKRTETFYDTDGTTELKVNEYDLVYDIDGELASAILVEV